MSEVVSYNKNMKLPMDNYIVRCTEENFGVSKGSGNPMVTLNFEIHAPEEVNIAGKRVSIAGVKLQPMWLVTQVIEGGEINAEKSAKCKARFTSEDADSKGMYQLFGLDPSKFNPENPVLEFKGKLLHARIDCKSEPVLKEPTPEQAAKGEKGDVVLNPITKEPVVRNQPFIAEIYGLAATSGL